ncbi:MAG: hypothetical protein R6V40_04245 [Candidatus Moraniibacteriota bacterium]
MQSETNYLEKLDRLYQMRDRIEKNQVINSDLKEAVLLLIEEKIYEVLPDSGVAEL